MVARHEKLCRTVIYPPQVPTSLSHGHCMRLDTACGISEGCRGFQISMLMRKYREDLEFFVSICVSINLDGRVVYQQTL